MSGEVVKKCSYFNSGYCRYTKKEMGCKNYHPSDVCQLPECREKAYRHPKKCKFEDKITNANKANAAGVIVINNNPTGVITMSIGGKTCCSNSLLWAHCLGCPQSK